MLASKSVLVLINKQNLDERTMNLTIFFTVLQSVIFIKAPTQTKEMLITFNQNCTGSCNRWLEMEKGENGIFSFTPECQSDSVITFKTKYTLEDNSSITTNWTSILYDEDLITTCYNSVALVIICSLIVLAAFCYSYNVLFLKNMFQPSTEL